MNCGICLNQYDHSIHKPFSLSCPHTICVSCVNLLNETKCPICNTEIKAKYPNIALLNFIPESEYDKLKASSQKLLIELSEMKNTLKYKSETKLNEYLDKINSARIKIKNETNKLIGQLRINEMKLLNESNEVEKYFRENFSLPKECATWLNELKLSVDNNSRSEEELESLVHKSESLKKTLKELETKVEEFKDNIEFTVYENICLSDGLIGEIQTNEKKFKNFNLLVGQSVEQKNYKEAIDRIDKAIEVCPANVKDKIKTFSYKALILTYVNKYDDSLDLFQKCIDLNPNNEALYYKKSLLLFILRRYTEALDAINKALELDPKHIRNHNFKGKILLKLKNYSEARSLFEKSIELDPKNCENFKLKGEVCFEMKNYLEAIDCFNKALELNPDCSEYFTFKGKALKHLNQMDAAINCYNEAIKKNQNYAPAYFLLSEYFYEQKNYESALSAIDKACYVDSSDSSYKSFRFNIQKRIEEIGSSVAKRPRII